MKEARDKYTDQEVIEIDRLFQISQFEHSKDIEVDRLYDILDRIYQLLILSWVDQTGL